MGKIRTYTKKSELVDFKGLTRPFVVAAVIEDDPKEVVNYQQFKKFAYGLIKPSEVDKYDIDLEIKLGVSILHENDEFDEELGNKIAIGKANKKTTCVGNVLINEKYIGRRNVIDLLLDNLIERVQSTPEEFIKGYEKQKAKFLLNKQNEVAKPEPESEAI